MKKKKILVLFGGRSGEHEVSVRSAASVIGSLDPNKYEITPAAIGKQGHYLSLEQSVALLPANARRNLSTKATVTLLPEPASGKEIDVVFPVLHGTYGEDGTVQGLLELADVAYVGAGVLGSAVSMDKDIMKRLFRERGLPTVDHITLLRGKCLGGIENIEARFSYPVFVKPANLGSSVGVTKALNRRELQNSIELAAKYDRKIIVEPAIKGREIECSVLGNDNPEISVPGEIVFEDGFYDYKAKYITQQSSLLIPASLSGEQTKRVQRLAIEAFRAVEGRGLARVDFFLEKGTENILLNEINSMPGFTRISMYPKLWAATGLSHAKLLDRLIELAIEFHEEKKLTRFNLD